MQKTEIRKKMPEFIIQNKGNIYNIFVYLCMGIFVMVYDVKYISNLGLWSKDFRKHCLQHKPLHRIPIVQRDMA